MNEEDMLNRPKILDECIKCPWTIEVKHFCLPTKQQHLEIKIYLCEWRNYWFL